VLKAHPELVRVQIEGHTDDRGSASFNLALSQKRADSVRAALLRRGIEPARLLARGVGLSRPVASNATDQGREKNRRVEFHVVQRRIAGEVIELE